MHLPFDWLELLYFYHDTNSYFEFASIPIFIRSLEEGGLKIIQRVFHPHPAFSLMKNLNPNHDTDGALKSCSLKDACMFTLCLLLQLMQQQQFHNIAFPLTKSTIPE